VPKKKTGTKKKNGKQKPEIAPTVKVTRVAHGDIALKRSDAAAQ